MLPSGGGSARSWNDYLQRVFIPSPQSAANRYRLAAVCGLGDMNLTLGIRVYLTATLPNGGACHIIYSFVKNLFYHPGGNGNRCSQLYNSFNRW